MKRLTWVLLPLLVVPLIALSWLSWSLAGRAEDRLVRAERARHVALAAAFTRRFDDTLRHLAAAFRQWAEQVADRSPDAVPPAQGQAWTLVFDADGRWWYPPRYATGRLSGQDVEQHPPDAAARQQLSEAARHERSAATMELAAQEYAALDRGSVGRQVRAEALFGLARCARATHEPRRAAAIYLRLIEQFADVTDEVGTNFGAEAARAYLDMSTEAGAEPLAKQVWRDHVDALLAGRYPMAWALTLTHLTDGLARAPSGEEETQDAERRQQLQEAIARLEAMSQVVAESPGRPRRSAFGRHGTRVLLWQPVSLPGLPGWVVASFDTAWVRSTLIEPLLDSLHVTEGGVVCVRDEFDTVVSGTPIEAEARTTEVMLSRWGLPWTLCVGFADFASLRAGATRRHALLTGSIGVLLVLIATGAAIGWRMVRREMELSQLKSDFVDNVSHELRTPVTSIKMFSEMLRSGQVDDPERQQEYYRLLASESNRLARMVENMLNFSRIVAGKMRLVRRPTDMGDYLRGLQRDLQIQAGPTGHRVRLHLGTELPTCAIDRDAVSRAVANLISNAIKYSPDQREITLTAQRRDGMLSLMVRDRGVGIPPSELPYVFDRFYRARRRDGDHVQGTGLGLTIVKDTIERHGGTVRMESRVGEGTVVELLIPIEPQASTSCRES